MKKVAYISKDRLFDVINNAVRTVVDNFVCRQEMSDELKKVPVRKRKDMAWCVMYRTTEANGKHEYYIERNVYAQTPEQAIRHIIHRCSEDLSALNVIYYIAKEDGNIG